MTDEFIGSGGNRIVLDWDGTLVESVWPEQGDWLPGARQFIQNLLDAGLTVTIMSTRIAPMQIDEETPSDCEPEIAYIRRLLDEAGFEEVDIWDPRHRPWKPGARFYVDDKALRFAPEEGHDYADIEAKILGEVIL